MSDWRDDRDRDQLDFDDEYGAAPTRAQGEGVRILGPDESLTASIESTARDFQERTYEYWSEWSRTL